MIKFIALLAVIAGGVFLGLWSFIRWAQSVGGMPIGYGAGGRAP